MSEPIAVRVQAANPGQFFACCGLFELADRWWHGAEAWFEAGRFRLRATHTEPPRSLSDLLAAITGAPLEQADSDDDYASPLIVGAPRAVRLDWWKDDRSGGTALKVWAGSMRSVRIARAMQVAVGLADGPTDEIFEYASVVYDPAEPDKKVEPFYFDSRRGSNAHPADIGFSPDALQMTTVAFPAVEFLCLVGLQRFRPATTARRRLFEYCTWQSPLPLAVAPLAVCGELSNPGSRRFRFENTFRTDQRKHKGFAGATAC